MKAAAGSAIVFAEITYKYAPLVGAWALGNFTIRREAAFYVRDERDLTQIYNDTPPATKSACNVFNTTFS